MATGKIPFAFLLVYLTNLCQSQDNCCRIVIVRSDGPAKDFQETRLGVYKKINGRLNQRPVYKHVLAESFLFFWDYDEGGRWVSGDSPRKGVHGIEAGDDGQGPCVDQLGPTTLKVDSIDVDCRFSYSFHIGQVLYNDNS